MNYRESSINEKSPLSHRQQTFFFIWNSFYAAFLFHKALSFLFMMVSLLSPPLVPFVFSISVALSLSIFPRKSDICSSNSALLPSKSSTLLIIQSGRFLLFRKSSAKDFLQRLLTSVLFLFHSPFGGFLIFARSWH